jgi:RND family efflux transporter MFP subunit
MKSSKAKTPKRAIYKSKFLWALVFVLLAGGSAAAWYFLGGPGSSYVTSASAATPDYHTATVQQGDLKISATGTGTLIASQSVDLSFSVSGAVTEVDVKVGDQVTSGQVLAKMGNSESLQAAEAAAQVTYLTAEQSLTDLQQNASLSLAQAYQDWVTSQETYNTAVYTQQRTTMARCSKEVNTKDTVALDNTNKKLQSETAWEPGSADWIMAKNDYDTALANYNYCMGYTADEKTNAVSSLEVAKVAMQQAETKYNALKAASGIDPSTLALDEAIAKAAETNLAQAKKNLGGTVLTAPIDGTVIYLAASAGTIFDTSKFITIADLSHPTVQVSLDETDLNKLVTGSPANVVFDALPDQTFTGQVIQVQPQLVTSGEYQVAQGLVLLDPGAAQTLETLPLGLSSSVEVISKEVKNAVLVPNEAIKSLGDKQYAVFVVGSDGTLRLTPVQIGIADATYTQVTSGLKVGEVVSTGVTQVSNKSSATAQ